MPPVKSALRCWLYGFLVPILWAALCPSKSLGPTLNREALIGKPSDMSSLEHVVVLNPAQEIYPRTVFRVQASLFCFRQLTTQRDIKAFGAGFWQQIARHIVSGEICADCSLWPLINEDSHLHANVRDMRKSPAMIGQAVCHIWPCMDPPLERCWYWKVDLNPRAFEFQEASFSNPRTLSGAIATPFSLSPEANCRDGQNDRENSYENRGNGTDSAVVTLKKLPDGDKEADNISHDRAFWSGVIFFIGLIIIICLIILLDKMDLLK